VKLRPLLLAVAAGVFVPAAQAEAPMRLAEMPGVEVLPPVPPLAPPQPPLTEIPPLRGTVFARNRVVVGIDGDGSARTVAVVQRLVVDALGDYTFFIPAPAVSVEAALDSESQPGFRPNQIVWQGFSPRRKVLAAHATLRPRDSVGVLPLRVRVSRPRVGPGDFELVVTLENATRTRALGFSGDAVESDVVAALDVLRAVSRRGRALEGPAVRIRGKTAPLPMDVTAPLAVRGTVSFPGGAVRSVSPAAFSTLVGENRRTARITIRGEAAREVSPRIRIVAEPVLRATLPARGVQDLRSTVAAYLRYARALQYESFLANPDPRGPSSTSYAFETAVVEPVAGGPRSEPKPGGGLFDAFVVVAVALLGLGVVVLWAHL
jgi:hypothetical protein